MRYARPLLLAGSLIALVATFAVMRMTTADAGALEPTITLVAPADDVHVGDEFIVTAYAEHFSGVGAFELELRFDDEAVAFLSFDEGDVLGSTGRTVYCIPGPSTSQDVMFGCATSGAAPGASGEGILAWFTFTALQEGNTDIRLRDAAIADVNGDPIDVDTEGTTVYISDASAGEETVTHTQTVAAQPTSGTTSTVEPDETVEVTETAAPDDTETAVPTEQAATNTPVPTSTEAVATETPVVPETPDAETPTVAAETETPEPEETVDVTQTPEEGETTTPETTQTVETETETPAAEETPTPEERATETATPDLTKPSETPESTGTPGFVPPTATPGHQTATTTSVATSTNTVVVNKTHTPAASTSTPDTGTTPGATSSPGVGATVAATQTETNEVLGVTNPEPEGIVLPVTGSGGDDGSGGSLGYVGILLAAGMAATMAVSVAVRRRAQ